MDTEISIPKQEIPVNFETIAKAARAALKKEVKHLQLIPAAAVKLLQLTNDDNTKVKDLSRVIETEPALAAKVLRIVNSAAFCLPKKIVSIKHAVNMLGFSQVRQTALDQLFYNRLIRHKTKQQFDQLFFWQHCLFVATLSRSIAVALKHPDPDMVYTGGLLHDIGKVVFESYGRVTYSDFLVSLGTSDSSLIDNEGVFFGLTHTEMGCVFAMTWNLPPAITAMIACHHELPKASSPYAEFSAEIAIVSFANYIAWVQGVGSISAFSAPRLPEQVLKTLDTRKLDLEDLLRQVDRDMANTREFYGIQFPDIAVLRATSVQTAIKLGDKPDAKTRAAKTTSLTIPHRSLDPDEFIPLTLEAIHNDFGLDRVVMLTIDPKRRGLVARHGWPRLVLEDILNSFQIPIESITGDLLECLRHRKPVIIKTADNRDRAILKRLQTDEFIAMPILRHNRLAGLIYADNALTRTSLDETLLFRLIPIVNELGIALLNAGQYDMARKQAQIDPLTKLFNKRVINEFLTRLFQSEAEILAKTAVGFIDIDKFKSFNDVCGHQAGDDVLKIVADILRSLTRPGDLIGRYGGEEFLFVLRDTDKVGALGYAERIRQEIERRGKILSDRFQGHALTVSVGLTLYSPRYESYHNFIETADQAMYQAKQQGRNRVVVLTGEA
ncbi:MAG: diguanylate cyclase [Gammaproteobacteria bacterium HGW-Gammaproteobacteria-3]|nr:MAG: diguanylate cyclase [Gammaproteobacteria bacterium HGW-Gammaproteobacteria-3]